MTEMTTASSPDDVPQDPTAFEPGTTVGGYRLLGTLGEGGFGLVYEAEQTTPARRVALKIIKAGMDSKSVIARFEAERQALAVMDHPSIAKVFDGGLTPPQLGSRPFFAMELVRGVPITEFCDSNRLDVMQRCELFMRVCSAVQHAHSKGVIHRDLKPSNVLVYYDSEGRAQPKVIDFGVAKALNQRLTERTIFTERGQLIGTLEYMSPEQAEMSGLDIDTRSDVYSLGVMLYELVTGFLPFDSRELRAAGFAELQRYIRESEPPVPSQRLSASLPGAETSAQIAWRRSTDVKVLTTLLKRELDWLIMHCLEKDRERRYRTATELAEDISRFLAGEPLSVGAPSFSSQCRRFWKQYRTVATTGAVLVLFLGGIATTSFVLLGEANRARAESEELLRKSDAQAEVLRHQVEKLRARSERTATMSSAADAVFDLLNNQKRIEQVLVSTVFLAESGATLEERTVLSERIASRLGTVSGDWHALAQQLEVGVLGWLSAIDDPATIRMLRFAGDAVYDAAPVILDFAAEIALYEPTWSGRMPSALHDGAQTLWRLQGRDDSPQAIQSRFRYAELMLSVERFEEAHQAALRLESEFAGSASERRLLELDAITLLLVTSERVGEERSQDLVNRAQLIADAYFITPDVGSFHD